MAELSFPGSCEQITQLNYSLLQDMWIVKFKSFFILSNKKREHSQFVSRECH